MVAGYGLAIVKKQKLQNQEKHQVNSHVISIENEEKLVSTKHNNKENWKTNGKVKIRSKKKNKRIETKTQEREKDKTKTECVCKKDKENINKKEKLKKKSKKITDRKNRGDKNSFTRNNK